MSHGCIRVSEPVALAAFLLRDAPGWSTERIQEAMTNGPDDVRVDLPRPVPVFITYATAEATAEGEVHFYSDVYGLDQELDALLRRGYPYPTAKAGVRRLPQGRISTEVPSGMTR
jgi:murein L,D-transpeptidase YcbB/YkuD